MKNVVLLGDFNARNSCWGDKIRNNRGIGRILEIIIQDSTFNCLNDGSCTFKKDFQHKKIFLMSLGSVELETDFTIITTALKSELKPTRPPNSGGTQSLNPYIGVTRQLGRSVLNIHILKT